MFRSFVIGEGTTPNSAIGVIDNTNSIGLNRRTSISQSKEWWWLSYGRMDGFVRKDTIEGSQIAGLVKQVEHFISQSDVHRYEKSVEQLLLVIRGFFYKHANPESIDSLICSVAESHFELGKEEAQITMRLALGIDR